MIINPTIIEWSALIIGTIGTTLWALGKNQLIISILWMISSILWIFFAIANGHYGLTARDSLGIVLCAVGIRTYWLSHRKTKTEENTILDIDKS